MRIQQRMQSYPIVFLLCCVLALATAGFPDNCIVGCKCEDGQKILDCDSVIVLTKETLANISKKIITVKFQNLYIKRIEKDAFDEFKDLQNIIFEYAGIGSIDPLAFDLHDLKSLKFAKTSFGDLPSFRSNVLEELIFDECALSKVPDLIELPELSFLNLANNEIKTIDETAFGNLSALEEIRLSNNTITELPYNLFRNNTDLITLNLDHNPIKTIRLNLTSELESLSLRYCKLSTFDRGSSENLTVVSTLDLSANEIEVLPIDAFENMKELQILDLSNNKLVELDDDIFSENFNLRTVDLSNNPLDTLPHFQTKEGDFLSIYTLACQNCSLTSIHSFENKQISALENLISLQNLDLSDNKIENIDGAFSEIHDLKTLLLSNNNLKSLGENSFARNASVEILDLSNNPLDPLDPVAFVNIQYLKKLNVTNSSLTELWSNHNAILPRLEQLYIGHNNIQTISVDDVKVTPEVKVINLSHNPLVCDNSFKEVIHFLKFKSVSQRSTDILTHEQLVISGPIDAFILKTPKAQWNEVLRNICGVDAMFEEESVTDSTIENELEEYLVDEDDDDSEEIDDEDDGDDDEDDDEYDDDVMLLESTSNDGNLSLRRAYYVLSISAVFILTALVVLIVAVAVTLLILKKNKSFNMHTGNLPRLKIPLWHTTPGQKKHSGSVYRPLSEDLSGSRTPIINRYEFKQTPQVHNSLP